jgi:hypothetical protein
MDARVEEFYKTIFTDLKVDQEEAQELVEYFDGLNPPPDKLVWLRATAFRLACGFLSDDNDANVALLRAINAIVHSLENTCMVYVQSKKRSRRRAYYTVLSPACVLLDLHIILVQN